LGALGADYDGDDAAVFAIRPGELQRATAVTPPRIALHEFWKSPMFTPGKQYVYGLHLLTSDARNRKLFERFKGELAALVAPPWPVGKDARDALDTWCRDAAEKEHPDGRWWAIVEKYALLALTADPGMGLGVFSNVDDILELSVVKCQAAKKELFDGKEKKQRRLTNAILKRGSLSLLSGPPDQVIDPIGEIMAAAQKPKGQFGNEIRHLVFKADTADPKIISAAQAVTEKLTQAVLSVKSVGKPLPKFSDYKRVLRRRWIRSKRPVGRSKEQPLSPAISELVAEVQKWGIQNELDRAFQKSASDDGQDSTWRQWLFAPYELLKLLHPDGKKCFDCNTEIVLPGDDLRVSRLLSSKSRLSESRIPPTG